MNTDLVYDHVTNSMVHPIAFHDGSTMLDGIVEFENPYYQKNVKWFLDYFQESQLLGYILLPDTSYYSIRLKSPIGPYQSATPCIFYKRMSKSTGRGAYKFRFDTESKNTDDAYFDQFPYVVMMRGCDDGHLGVAVRDLEDAKDIFMNINSLGLTDIQDIHHLREIQGHN